MTVAPETPVEEAPEVEEAPLSEEHPDDVNGEGAPEADTSGEPLPDDDEPETA